MWYIKFSWTMLVFMVIFTAVTGSCLEYGHSCWGAHGKRSGGKAATNMANGETHKQQPTANYADNIAELFNNDENNFPATHSGEAAARDEAKRIQQRRYQLLQMRQNKRSNHDELEQVADSSAESWRKLSPLYGDLAERRAAWHKALLLQQLAEQQRQQQATLGDYYELKK